MLKWLQELIGTHRAQHAALSGVPKTHVLVSFHYLHQHQGQNLAQALASLGLDGSDLHSFAQAIRRLTQQGNINLIVSDYRTSLRRDVETRFTLDLDGKIAFVIEPFEQRNLAIVTECESPETSSALLEAHEGRAKVLPVGSLLKFHLSDAERPLLIYCHVCNGSGSVPCRRCDGKGWFQGRSGKKLPCGAEGCSRGKQFCAYCKGEKFRGCKLLHHKHSFTIALPEQIRGIDDIPIFVDKDLLIQGSNLLFRQAEAADVVPHSSPSDAESLGAKQETFDAQLREMHRFLLAEVEAETEDFLAVRVDEGRFVDHPSGGRQATLAFRILGGRQLRSSIESRMILVSPAESVSYRVSLVSHVGDDIVIAVLDHLQTGDRIPASGFLLSGEGLRIFEAQSRALRFWGELNLSKSPMKRALCFPESLEFSAPETLPFFYSDTIANNPAQREAIEKALDERRALFCIQGPPGTGKTTVITEIIAQHLKRGGGRVLVSSQSNLAVDNVLERLVELSGVNLIRVGRAEKVLSHLHNFLLDRHLEGLASDLRRSRAAEILQAADVVGATCIGADHPFLRVQRGDRAEQNVGFDLVIVDEAGRSTPMETLVPMQLAKRAILVGDHKQLPPVVSAELRETWVRKNPNSELDESVGAVSLFESLARTLAKDSMTVLRRQFRMHPQIGEFIGRTFYPGEGLENGITAEARSLPLPGFPAALSYHSTESFGDSRFEYRPKGGTSFANKAEVELISGLLGLLDMYVEAQGVPPPTVGVICFYSAQVELLRTKLRANQFSGLAFHPEEDVSSLDAFQGKEKDVIILSLVRCPREARHFNAEWYQFFLDVRRLNVALSRAKRRLLIVGDIKQILEVEQNRETLKGFHILQELFQFIQTNRLEVMLSAEQ